MASAPQLETTRVSFVSRTIEGRIKDVSEKYMSNGIVNSRKWIVVSTSDSKLTSGKDIDKQKHQHRHASKMGQLLPTNRKLIGNMHTRISTIRNPICSH